MLSNIRNKKTIKRKNLYKEEIIRKICLLVSVIFFVAFTFAISKSKGEIQMITINLNCLNGNIQHGANGGHYALNEVDTPDVKILKAFKPVTISQKAPDGLQHPGGDAFRVSKTFKEAGGKFIQVYMQDIYPLWPYDNVPIEDYYEKVKQIISKFKNIDNRNFFILIPFNEPDAIWFNNNFSKFLEAWEYVFKLIKQELPDIKIGGPNFANYNEFLMEEFLTYSKLHSCIPDVITWHELNDSFFFNWEENVKTYRRTEKRLGIKEKEIIINEYGRPGDLGVPGQLIKWIAKLEKAHAYGGLAFWHIAGNFDDLVVENQKPNGAWWLYKWYSEMSGQIVQTTLPQSYNDGECLATFDKEKEQIRILVGGTDKDIRLLIKGFDKYRSIYGNKVKIKLLSTEWSGQQGELISPQVHKEEVTKIINNEVKIDILSPISTQVYYLVITPFNSISNKEPVGEGRVVYDNRDKKSYFYEAEEAETDGSLEKDPNYFCSGNWRVMLSKNNYLKYVIHSPQTGEYEINVFYSTHTRNFADFLLVVNNNKQYKLLLPPTISKGYIGKKTIKVFFKKGENILKFVNNSKESVSIDNIKICESKVKYQNYESIDLDIEGEIIEGKPQYYYEENCYIAMNPGDKMRFSIVVPERGFYSIVVNSSFTEKNQNLSKGILKIYINNLQVNEVGNKVPDTFAVFLEEGVNIIEVEYSSVEHRENNKLILKDLRVKRVQEFDSFITKYEAEDKGNNLYGKCVRRVNSNASNNQDITNVGLDSKSYIKFNNIIVPKKGLYKLIVYYANNTTEGNHPYNIKIVDIYGRIKVNGSTTYSTTFRYTGCDRLYYQRSLDIYLEKGANYIEIYTDKKLIVDKIEISPIMVDN